MEIREKVFRREAKIPPFSVSSSSLESMMWFVLTAYSFSYCSFYCSLHQPLLLSLPYYSGSSLLNKWFWERKSSELSFFTLYCKPLSFMRPFVFGFNRSKAEEGRAVRIILFQLNSIWAKALHWKQLLVILTKLDAWTNKAKRYHYSRRPTSISIQPNLTKLCTTR